MPLLPLPLTTRRVRSRRVLGTFAGPVLALAVLILLPVCSAAFTATSATHSSGFSAGTLQPPSGLSLSSSCPASPAPSFDGAASFSSNGGTSVAVATPGHAGDVLLATVAGAASPATFSAPSWTLVRQDSTSGLSVAVYSRAYDPNNTTGTFTGPAGLVATISAYSGVSSSQPINASAAATGSSATVTAPSVTSTVSMTQTFISWSLAAYGAVVTPSNGSLPVRTSVASGSESTVVSDKATAAAGAAGAETASAGVAGPGIGIEVALAPPALANVLASFTPTSTTWASGYRLTRLVSGNPASTVTATPRTASTATDTGVPSGATYTYQLVSYYNGWTSTPVSQTLSVPPC